MDNSTGKHQEPILQNLTHTTGSSRRSPGGGRGKRHSGRSPELLETSVPDPDWDAPPPL